MSIESTSVRYNTMNLDLFLRENFSDNEVNSVQDEFEDSINDLIEIYENNPYSIFIGNIISPTTLGLGFFKDSNLFTAINMIIPDLLRESFVRDPINFRKSPPLICPTYSRIPLKLYPNIKYSYNNFYQLILEENAIKALLYFNFTSNAKYFSIKDIPYYFLKYRYFDSRPLNSETVNNYSYTKPSDIFSILYDGESLLVQLLKFAGKINSVVQNANTNNTNYPPVNIPWVTTYACINNVPNPNKFFSYNNVENPLEDNLLLYADMFYLNKSRDNYIDVSNEFGKFLNLPSLSDAINKNNIYVILDYASEVYNEILKEIGALETFKEYNYPVYTSVEYLIKSVKLFCNYIANEYFIFKDSPNFNPEDIANICDLEILEEILIDLSNTIYDKNYDITIHNKIREKLEQRYRNYM